MAVLTPDALIFPDWPVPATVHTAITTRHGGVSAGPWASLNLGQHVGDNPDHVSANRSRLSALLALPHPPCWLNQVHGVDVAIMGAGTAVPASADAAVTREPGLPLVMMTADCLPVLLCDRRGTVVAASHAGWRGLAAGVLENTVAAMGVDSAELLAYLGPAISQKAFEVGIEVRDVFVAGAGSDAQKQVVYQCFQPGKSPDKWMADIYGLARAVLQRCGVSAIYGGDFCTYSDEQRFYSYRRDGVTGRMASLIWLSP